MSTMAERPGLLTRLRTAFSDTEMAHEPGSATRRPSMREIGTTGVSVFGGILQSQDYNTDLHGDLLYDVYDRMRLADGQVKAGLSVVKLPLLRADWSIEAASDSARDHEIAEFIESDLMNMKLSWASTLRQAMLHLDYGNMPFEKVWEVRDGRIHLRKLAPRLPRTVIEYNVDAAGGLTGLRQQAMRDNVMTDIRSRSISCWCSSTSRRARTSRATLCCGPRTSTGT